MFDGEEGRGGDFRNIALFFLVSFFVWVVPGQESNKVGSNERERTGNNDVQLWHMF